MKSPGARPNSPLGKLNIPLADRIGSDKIIVCHLSRGNVMKVFLVRQHVQVGDEIIHGVALKRALAEAVAKRYREKTKTNNFDVVEMESDVFPDAREIFSS